MAVNNKTLMSYCRYGNNCSYYIRSITSSLILLLTVQVFMIDAKSTPLFFPDESDDSPLSSTTLTPIVTKTVKDTIKICPIDGTRYDNATNECWKVKEKGPCPDTQIFYAFFGPYGDCECKLEEGLQSTAWVYNEKYDRCYKTYEQAYCKPGEWLVFSDKDGSPTCVRNKCEKLQQESPEENKDHPVVLHENTCVRLAKDMGVGSCFKSDFIIMNHETGKPVCSSLASRNVGSVSGFKCRPGTRRDKLGKCRTLNSKVTFRPSS